MRMRRLVTLARRYGWGGRRSNPRAAGAFWYLPEPPTHADRAGLDGYAGRLRDPSARPEYPIDYTRKTGFPRHEDDELVVLDYAGAIGPRFNPEAAAMELLGRWNLALGDGTAASTASFLRGVEALHRRADAGYRFAYDFDWNDVTAPWHSALAQSRCASVFLRAHRAAGEERHRRAALESLRWLAVDEREGGVLSRDRESGTPFASEYARSEIGVLNGLMATVIGVRECLMAWPSADLGEIDRVNREALRRFLPRCEARGWTLYQFAGPHAAINPHSPRYHRMCCNYLAVLAALTGDPWFDERAARWRAMDTPLRSVRAAVDKALFKLRHR